MSDERLPLASHTLVRIRAFGEIDDRPGSIELAPTLIAQLGWGIDDGEVVLVSTASETKVRKVTVPIGAVTHDFPASGIPMLPMERLVGAPQDPSRPGSMPLSGAAYWIASKAGSAALRMDDRDAWRSAYVELRDRIVSGQVRLIGRPKSGAVPEAISGVHFSGLEIELAWMLTNGEVFSSTTLDRPRIHCAGVVSNDEWIAGDTDELWGRRYGEKLFTHLEVMNQDIARLWPSNGATATTSAKISSRKRGPKFKYDWDAFHAEVHRKLSEEGGIAPDVDPGPGGFKQADLEAHMRDWSEQEWGLAPGESTIREKVSGALR
jgi:hypothetical protein